MGTNGSLTPRELDILAGVVAGQTNAEIAQRLVLSVDTVRWYVKQLYGKLDVHSREEAVAQALALGLAPPAAAPLSPASPSPPAIPLVNLLPQDVSGRYVGQAEKLAQLASLLRRPARLISIYGRGGAGKTALACKALDDLRQAAPAAPPLSGILCLSAAGTGISLNRLVADLGRLLAERDQAILEAITRNQDLSPAQMSAVVLEQIEGRRIVVLLDNLETIQDPATGALAEAGLQQFIEVALKQSSALTFLITSREPLQLPGSLQTWEHLISLEGGLPAADAVVLLRKLDPSGATELRAAPEAELVKLAERVGGVPRALEAMAGALLEDPLLRLADLKRDLDALDGETSAAVVQQALAHLNAESMRVLQALAVFDRAVSYEALAHVLAPYLPNAAVRARLGRLVRASFVKGNRATQQLALHPLDQDFCYQQIPTGSPTEAALEPPPFTRAALHQRAAGYYRQQRLPRAAWRRLADLAPLMQEFHHRVRAGDGDGAARVVLDMDRDHLWEWDYWDLLRQLYAALDEAPVRDPHLELQVARRRAWLNFFTAPEQADAEFARQLESARRQGFVKEEADALDDLAQTFRRNKASAQQSSDYHQLALALYRQVGDRRGEADALGGLGAVFADVEPEAAVDDLLAAVAIQRELGNRNSLSFLLATLGIVYASLGAVAQAKGNLEEAVQAARESVSLDALGRAYSALAEFYVSLGDIPRARACLDEARRVSREISGVPITSGLLLYTGLAATAMATAGETQAAVEVMQSALREAAASIPQYVPVGNQFLCVVLMLHGDTQAARALLSPMLEVMVTRLSPFSFWIGVLLIKAGERDRARVFFNRMLELAGPLDAEARPAPHAFIQTLGMRAVVMAGLALLNDDAGAAARAAELTRQALRLRHSQTQLLRALIQLLLPEPGAEILAPVRAMLEIHPARPLR